MQQENFIKRKCVCQTQIWIGDFNQYANSTPVFDFTMSILNSLCSNKFNRILCNEKWFKIQGFKMSDIQIRCLNINIKYLPASINCCSSYKSRQNPMVNNHLIEQRTKEGYFWLTNNLKILINLNSKWVLRIKVQELLNTFLS